MHKDPTQFRERFKSYKDGKSISDIYEFLPGHADGRENRVDWKRWDDALTTSYVIPFLEDKAITLTNAGRATGARLSTNLLDSLADNAVRAGVPVRTAIGLATKESTLGNPTDDRSAWNLSSGIRLQFGGTYPGTHLHINYGKNLIRGHNLINYHKGKQDVFSGAPHTNKKSTIQEGLEFYKQHPDKYNPGQPGYQRAVEARANDVMLSPEVQKWYKDWEANQILIIRPEPYKINTTVQSTAPKKFGKYADGKLLGFEDGQNVTYEVNLPEVVITPDRNLIRQVRETWPNPAVRKLVLKEIDRYKRESERSAFSGRRYDQTGYDSVTHPYTSSENVHVYNRKPLPANYEVERAMQLVNASGNPHTYMFTGKTPGIEGEDRSWYMPHNSHKGILGLVDSIGSRLGIKAFQNTRKGLHISPLDDRDPYLAELSHAYLFANKLDKLGNPSTSARSLSTSEYENPNNIEFQAHLVIQPALYGYLRNDESLQDLYDYSKFLIERNKSLYAE